MVLLLFCYLFQNSYLSNYLAKFYSLIAAIAFGLVNFNSLRIRSYTGKQKARVLSFCGGVIATYVFVDLIPSLQMSAEYLKSTGSNYEVTMAYEDLVYLLVLAGFLLFFSLEYYATGSIQESGGKTTKKQTQSAKNVYLVHYVLLVFLDFVLSFTLFFEYQSSVFSGVIFTFAVALHLFIAENSMVEKYGSVQRRNGRYFASFIPVIAWIASIVFPEKIAEAYILLAFISGSILYTAIKDEIPAAGRKRSLLFFLIGAVFYALLLIGQSLL